MSSWPMALSVTVVEGLPQPEPSRKIHHLSPRKKNANPGGVSAKTRTQCYCSHKCAHVSLVCFYYFLHWNCKLHFLAIAYLLLLLLMLLCRFRAPHSFTLKNLGTVIRSPFVLYNFSTASLIHKSLNCQDGP